MVHLLNKCGVYVSLYSSSVQEPRIFIFVLVPWTGVNIIDIYL